MSSPALTASGDARPESPSVGKVGQGTRERAGAASGPGWGAGRSSGKLWNPSEGGDSGASGIPPAPGSPDA